MKFESINIKNFRNFEEIVVDLSNKNIFIGLNDVGKTNFLYAIRFLFDKEIRKNNCLDSDFYKKNTDKPIEIMVTIDISEPENKDNQKLRAKLKGALLSTHTKVYIKLIAEFEKKEMLAIPELFWGGDLKNLVAMKPRGYMYEIDYVCNVIYIDSYVDLNKLFKKNIGKLVKNVDSDKTILDEIENTVSSLNEKISSLSGVRNFEQKITPEYQKYRNEKVAISVKSEIAVKGLYSNVVPYIRNEESIELYPTSGEGRKKLLAYSIFELLAEETEESKINIFLIEEPENHLHKSMQIALSRIIFNDDKFKYLFVSTHSPYILYEMDKANIVRIFNDTKIDSESVFYKVPKEFADNRKILNKGLTEAIFADRVLLVEGPSEEMLFDKVLTVIDPYFEANGGFILAVNGIGFKRYFEILDSLSIKNIIKTDNDLRKISSSGEYSCLGFSRVNNYIDKKYNLPTKPIADKSISSKRELYNQNVKNLDLIRADCDIYLSKVDLENDLDEFLHDSLSGYLGTENAVGYLQEAKHHHMVKLVNEISDEDCRKIYEHYNFACLKALVK